MGTLCRQLAPQPCNLGKAPATARDGRPKYCSPLRRQTYLVAGDALRHQPRPVQRSPLPKHDWPIHAIPPNFVQNAWLCIRSNGFSASVSCPRAFLDTTAAAYEAGPAYWPWSASRLTHTVQQAKATEGRSRRSAYVVSDA